ncbi:hypothetical protein GCM10027578_23420 [Spirosoma luteolum]
MSYRLPRKPSTSAWAKLPVSPSPLSQWADALDRCHTLHAQLRQLLDPICSVSPDKIPVYIGQCATADMMALCLKFRRLMQSLAGQPLPPSGLPAFAALLREHTRQLSQLNEQAARYLHLASQRPN